MAVNNSNPEPAENINAWQFDTYVAWIRRYGNPADAAAQVRKDPKKKLDSLLPHIGEAAGKRIVNIMGSSGIKALAFAMLGADVTVVDISPGNARYARELADAADVALEYIVADVLSLDSAQHGIGQFDFAFAELGIVHYFTDLNPFMSAVQRLLKPGGRFILKDFHPVSTKLLTYRGPTAKVRKYKVDGNYFDETLEQKKVSYAKHLPEPGKAPFIQWRKWTLGEIVTACASTGMRIQQLIEEPNLSSSVFDTGIPKTFTLVADN
jgi:SAM-dependent methyltransferase